MKITRRKLRRLIRETILFEASNAKEELERLVMHYFYPGSPERVQRAMDQMYKYDSSIDVESELQNFVDERPDGKKILSSEILSFMKKFKFPGDIIGSDFANFAGIFQIPDFKLAIINDHKMQTIYGVYFKNSLNLNLISKNKSVLMRLITDKKVRICIFDGSQAMGRPTLADPEFLSAKKASEKIEYLMKLLQQ
jgi:hypothetical protein